MSDIRAIGDFVKRKIKLLDEETSQSRAMCAKLRRAIGKQPGSAPDIWEVTIQGAPDSWNSRDDKPSYAEWAVHTSLTLYALHRQGKSKSMQSDASTFASATAKLIKNDPGRQEAVRRRFNAVATAMDFSELSHHARGLIQMLKAEDISMDYTRFAMDLYTFQSHGGADRVRLRWGEYFYRELDKNVRKDEEQ